MLCCVVVLMSNGSRKRQQACLQLDTHIQTNVPIVSGEANAGQFCRPVLMGGLADFNGIETSAWSRNRLLDRLHGTVNRPDTAHVRSIYLSIRLCMYYSWHILARIIVIRTYLCCCCFHLFLFRTCITNTSAVFKTEFIVFVLMHFPWNLLAECVAGYAELPQSTGPLFGCKRASLSRLSFKETLATLISF